VPCIAQLTGVAIVTKTATVSTFGGSRWKKAQWKGMGSRKTMAGQMEDGNVDIPEQLSPVRAKKRGWQV
jgi:hypothetical protein